APAQVAFGISVDIGPPALPVYVQPPTPAPNMIWTPGYWGWGPGGYYWVPGVWVYAPAPGYLWTPGYWAWRSGYYAWHPGYWATQVGYYGGINYGFGYFGFGYVGGGWYGSVFRYNTAVTNVNTTIVRNVYVDRTVIVNNNVNVTRVSYNGGPGGVAVRPTESELAVQRGYHMPATGMQTQHQRVAATDRTALATVNGGHPVMPAASAPYTRTYHPPTYEPLHQEDRVGAQQHVVHRQPPENQRERPANIQPGERR
ncbi:MAG: YXWGXW repeat-containing protein, partial [Candidatus Eremiobacteraeota bacterium]|nr:YXWGXW repeat-containing protein [Candidatus Eremiobacteraeota bacterium]